MYAKPKPRKSVIRTIPAPTRGLNDADSIANMDPGFAVDIKNFFPGQSSLVVRDGYYEWTTGMASMGKTLMSYNKFDGTVKLFAACDTAIYDVSTRGAVGASVKAITNGRLNYINFSNVASNYLVMCNGTDAAILYDGTTWTSFTQVGSPTNPGEVSGVNPNLFRNVHAHKNRLWFVEKNSMTARYLPTDAVAGAASPFYLGSVFKRGGYLQSIETWSIDAGDGLDDILVFISSKGEIAGYAGTDPSSASTWALQAAYFIGSTLNDRTAADLGGDLLFLTQNGLIPISKVVSGEAAVSAYEASLARNIGRTLVEAVTLRTQTPNWEVINAPTAKSLIILVPVLANFPPVQFVMNTVTGAWTIYDLPMQTAEVHNNKIYFTDTTGRVFVFGDVALDNVLLNDSGGTPVVSSVMPAHSYFGDMGVNKHFKMVRPIFTAIYAPSYNLAISVDFSPNGIETIPTNPTTPGDPEGWDLAIWDSTLWSPSRGTQFKWDGVAGVGFSGALVLKLSTNTKTEFVACDWVYEQGGSI